MDYLSEFHWWYLVVGIVFFVIVFGKGKGGVVKERLTADLQILDKRFAGCRPEADFCIFKEGEPVHLDIEIDNLAIPIGDELEFQINGNFLAKVKVKRNREAEFDHWSDEEIDFPMIKKGDGLLIRYKDIDALSGTFQ